MLIENDVLILDKQMSGNSEKEKRKEVLRQLKEKEKAEFFSSLPVDKKIFIDLFDYLDKNLANGCNHQMTLTVKFLEERAVVNVEQVIAWLNNNGGYCDCEVLFNIEERFE